jgi:hypothetical protein
MKSIRYVGDSDGQGWLSVVLDGIDPKLAANNPGFRVALPQHLKVNVYKTDKEREYFEILEGPNNGNKASVKLGLGGKSFLMKDGAHMPAAQVRINRKLQQLWFRGRGPFSAFTDPRNPVPIGVWELEIPDSPHGSPSLYSSYSNYYKTWFRIRSSRSSDRYLHLGVISHGCITARPWITDRTNPRLASRSDAELGLPIPIVSTVKLIPVPWDELYRYLIGARNNAQAVGTVIVTDI